MNLRHKYVLPRVFVRSWLGIPFALWLALSLFYFWWILSKSNVLEDNAGVMKSDFKLSRSMMNVLFDDSLLNNQKAVISNDDLCETIHLAVVCMNKCTRQITPMLKSLLYHRQNPIHFHFVVDYVAEKIMDELFKTWDLTDVKYTCYNAENKMWKVRWVPNSHYSGIYALLKLILPEVMPETLNQVIVLDSDLTFLSDINELWFMFRNMSKDQFFGLVENESNWYLEKGEKRWPALGRGYNTGVMLLDLKKMREKIQWTDLWHDTVKDSTRTYKQAMLADQDVINAIIKKNPHIVYNISCQYNVQMSTFTLSKKCYGENKDLVKIVHWNSPLKYDVSLQDTEYFRNIHKTFVNMDGYLLRGKLHSCEVMETTTLKLRNSDLCTSFRTAQRTKLRTHLYFMDYSYNRVDNFDVTLVLQLSMDRLQFLERLVKYWEGPLSAAIYLSDCEVSEFESFIRDWSDALSSRRNIGYHLVFKHNTVHYPVNYLRNVALENVNTPYVFLMDVDFVPMVGLYDHLRTSLQLINPYPQRKCLVVAAFETQRYRIMPPRDKAALVSRVRNAGDVAAFRAREWPRGHRATNYTRWITATAPYEVEWQPDYEPYLVVHRSVPRYDTRFSGFGWNKVSHSVELRARGYRPVVLPGAFVVHTPHAPSPDITKFRANTHYRICLALLKHEFMEDLKRKYNVTFEDASQPDSVYSQSKNNNNMFFNIPKA